MKNKFETKLNSQFSAFHAFIIPTYEFGFS